MKYANLNIFQFWIKLISSPEAGNTNQYQVTVLYKSEKFHANLHVIQIQISNCEVFYLQWCYIVEISVFNSLFVSLFHKTKLAFYSILTLAEIVSDKIVEL